MKVRGYRGRLQLTRPFVISTGATDAEENFFLRLEDDEGHTGWGEAAPGGAITGETPEAAADGIRELEANEEWVDRLLEDAEHIPGGAPKPAVRAALTTAFLDAAGRAQRKPLHRLLNLPEGRIESSVTISIGTPKEALAEAQEWDAEGWTTLKVKLGGPDDEPVMKALHDRYPDKVLRVDANGAWDLPTARERLRLLERLDVELVEQPLARDRLADSAQLAREFEIPVLLDESVLDSAGLLAAIRADGADGVNVKLAKCGGPFEARRMIKLAKDHGWDVMVGCMIESTLGVAAGAAFAGAADYADLDGNVYMSNDPFQGLSMLRGVVDTPTRPGVGVEPSPHLGSFPRVSG